jgi:hypothetical protein
MSRRFLHWAKQAPTKIESKEQRQSPKPLGLWFSVGDGDDGWRSWCESEGFRLDRLANVVEVILNRDARVLTIASAPDFDIFNDRFVVEPDHHLLPTGWAVDWAAVAREHDAIIIAPYRWDRRLSERSFWYYGWDCVSGCVWNADAVRELRPVASTAARLLLTDANI